MSDHNFDALRVYILARSVSKVWNVARLEWTLNGVEDLGEATETCPCGYHPIRYLCWLGNYKTKSIVFVGNVCVNRFIPELDSHRILEGLRRIQDDPTKAASEALLVWARRNHVITDWEYNFGLNTRLKRKLSPRQLETRVNLNERIEMRLLQIRQRQFSAKSGINPTINANVWGQVLALTEQFRRSSR